MPFERGSVSFRMLYVPHDLPKDTVDRFAAHAASPLDSVHDEQLSGWVTGRHLLDRQIDEDTAYYGGYLRLTLQTAERKIPSSLLHAECTMEELAVLRADGRDFLNRKERSKLKKEVADRLLPQMPPQVKGMPFVYRPGSKILYANAMSQKQCDLFTSCFQSTVGMPLFPLTTESLAMEWSNVDTREWRPTSFSPELSDASMTEVPGRDFLTWLWFVSEERGGTISLADGAQAGVLIEGPLAFAHEGNGAHEIVLRKGEPVGSAEAKTCLLCGKKLKQAKLSMAIGDDLWQTTVNADELAFRSLALPHSDEILDPVSLFQERMTRLERFTELFLALHDAFAKERSNSSGWSNTRKDIHKWVKGRTGRA